MEEDIIYDVSKLAENARMEITIFKVHSSWVLRRSFKKMKKGRGRDREREREGEEEEKGRGEWMREVEHT